MVGSPIRPPQVGPGAGAGAGRTKKAANATKAGKTEADKEREFQDSMRSFNRASFTFMLVVSLTAAIAPNRPSFMTRTEDERVQAVVDAINGEFDGIYSQEMRQWCDEVTANIEPEEFAQWRLECGAHGFDRYVPGNLDCTPFGDFLVEEAEVLYTDYSGMQQPYESSLRVVLNTDTGLIGYTTDQVNTTIAGEEIVADVPGIGILNTVGSNVSEPVHMPGVSSEPVALYVSEPHVDVLPSPGFQNMVPPSLLASAAETAAQVVPEQPPVVTAKKSAFSNSIAKQVAEKIRKETEKRAQVQAQAQVQPEPKAKPSRPPVPSIKDYVKSHPKKAMVAQDHAPLAKQSEDAVQTAESFTQPNITVSQDTPPVSVTAKVSEAILKDSSTKSSSVGQIIWSTVFGDTTPASSQPQESDKSTKQTKKKTKRPIPPKPRRKRYIPKDMRDPHNKGSVAEQVADRILDTKFDRLFEEIEGFEFGFNGKFMGLRKWHEYFGQHSFYGPIYLRLYTLCCNLVKALKYGREFASTVFGDFFSIFETVGLSMNTGAKVGTIQLWPLYRLVGGSGLVILLLHTLLILPLSIVLRYWGYAMQTMLDVYDYDSQEPDKPRRIFWNILYNYFIASLRFTPKPFVFLYNWIADTVMYPYGFSFEMGDYDQWGINYNTVLLGNGEMVRRGAPAASNDPTEYGLDTDAMSNMLQCIVIPMGQLAGRTFHMVREFNSSDIFFVPDEVWNREVPHRAYLPEIEHIRKRGSVGRHLLSVSRYGKRQMRRQRRAEAARSEPGYGSDIDGMVDMMGAIIVASDDAVGNAWIERKMAEYGSPDPLEICEDMWNGGVGYLRRWFSAKSVDAARYNELAAEINATLCHSGLPEFIDATGSFMGDVLASGSSECLGASTGAAKTQAGFNSTMARAIRALSKQDGWNILDSNVFAYAQPDEDITLDWFIRPSNFDMGARVGRFDHVVDSIPLARERYTRRATISDFTGLSRRQSRRNKKSLKTHKTI